MVNSPGWLEALAREEVAAAGPPRSPQSQSVKDLGLALQPQPHLYLAFTLITRSFSEKQ